MASGIGKPIQLDPITAKLEPLSYAKILVEASAEVPLPPLLSITWLVLMAYLNPINLPELSILTSLHIAHSVKFLGILRQNV